MYCDFPLDNKMVLLLEYMVWAAIHIIFPRYIRIHGNKCPFSL